MQLTLNSLSALRVIRMLRNRDVAGDFSRRCDQACVDPGPAMRWTQNGIRSGLSFLGDALQFSEQRPLDVLVPSKERRLRTKGIHCTYRSGTYPQGSFVDVGNGIVISGPELVFVELAQVMDPIVHLLLGMELCGRFSRSARDPRSGDIAYDVEPVTSIERLRDFAAQAHWIRGASLALKTIDRIVENAWSPMEALLAALTVLPVDELGYDLWPITLNPRKRLGERLERLSEVESRVPDIMFNGTSAGINYDGEDHFRLDEIVEAAVLADRNPGDARFSRQLEEAIADSRRCIVEDKRRDRDLLALGLSVFSATKEDIEQEGGLDRLMGQVIEAIEAEGVRDLSAQRRMLKNQSRAKARQLLVWSLIPGPHAASAQEKLAEQRERLERTHEFEIEFEMVDGDVKIISIEEL